jgi:hypothetical protein
VFGIIGLTRAIVLLTAELVRLRRVIGLRKPGLVFAKMILEGEVMSVFALVLPAPGSADVVARELVVSVNGGEPVTVTLDGTALESAEFVANQGDIVTGSLVDIDDAAPVGLRSEPSVFELVLADTIAPAQPGAVGARMVSE